MVGHVIWLYCTYIFLHYLSKSTLLWVKTSVVYLCCWFFSTLLWRCIFCHALYSDHYAISPSLSLPFPFGPLPTLPIFLSFISPSSLSSLFLSLSARNSIVMLLLFYFHIHIYIHTWICPWCDSELYLNVLLLCISHINCLGFVLKAGGSTVYTCMLMHRLFSLDALLAFSTRHHVLVLCFIYYMLYQWKTNFCIMDNKILNLVVCSKLNRE